MGTCSVQYAAKKWASEISSFHRQQSCQRNYENSAIARKDKTTRRATTKTQERLDENDYSYSCCTDEYYKLNGHGATAEMSTDASIPSAMTSTSEVKVEQGMEANKGGVKNFHRDSFRRQRKQTNSMICITTVPNELLLFNRPMGLVPTSPDGEFRHNCANQLSSPVDAVLLR
jgi:sRNA-binding protein